jgi:hypothetical protein
MMKAEPQKEHNWLHKLLGEWTYESTAAGSAGEQPSKATGTERVRSLGGLWVLAEGEGEMPGGGPATTLMTLGYDTEKKRYLGTWIGSMMTHMWIYDGEMDGAGKVLTLNSEGPSMEGDGSTAKYKDVIELKSDDHRVLTAHVLKKNGTWERFMTAEYRRKTR